MCDKKSIDSKKVVVVNKVGVGLKLNKSDGRDRRDGNLYGEGTSGYHRKHYDSDSFDRFGDDLVEVILRFLSFNDKVCLERVCRQWRRVIYNRQTVLQLNRSEGEEEHTLNRLLEPIKVCDYATGFAHYAAFKAINKPAFESILKKCPFIKSVDFECYCDGADLQLLGRYCKFLEEIECDVVGFNEKGLVRFGQQYGHRLKVIRFNNSTYGSRFIRKFLRFCPNVREIYTEDHSAFINDDRKFLPKLEIIKSLDIRVEHIQQLKILADKYRSQLRNIKIFSYNLIGFQSRTALSHISRFENLEELEIYIGLYDDDAQTLDDNIVELAKNCPKIKHFDFTINNDNLVTSRLLYAFGKFRSMEKFNLYFYDISKKLEGTCECLRHCVKLKHLNLSYKETGDEFFANIHEHLPGLVSIDIDTEKELSDETMLALSKLPNLQMVFMRQNRMANKHMSDAGVCALINSCKQISKMLFNARPNITGKTVEALMAAALKKPRSAIDFHCGFSNAGDEAQFAQIDLDDYDLPDNLKVAIEVGNNE